MKKLLKFFALCCALVLPACIFGGCNRIEAVGEFITLREAYNSGYVTRDDIMEMCYHRLGAVYELPEGLTLDDIESTDRDNWVEVDYTPRNAELAPLDELTEQDIKNSYYSLNREGFETGGQKYGPEVLELQFFGQFNGYYILRIRADIWGYSEAQYVADYDGVVFYELTSPAFEVFYYYN